MSNTAHTPEPWLSDGPHNQGLYIGGERHTYWTVRNLDTGVALIILPDSEKTPETLAEREATARRIVACVNGCKGIENPEAVGDMIAICRDLASSNDMGDHWIEVSRKTVAASEAVLKKAGLS